MLRLIRDRVIRHKVDFAKLDTGRFDVRIARTASEYTEAFALLQAAYVAQGYERVLRNDFRITDHHVLPASTVFVAYEGDALVGTATVTADGPAGLAMDRQDPAGMRAARADGATLAEIGSLAIVGRCYATGVAPLLSLATVRHAVHHMNVDRVVMGVSPKAQPYYEAVWACRQIGPARPHSALDIRIVLLAADFDVTRRHFERHFARPMRSGASALDYVFGDCPPPWHDLPRPMSQAEAARYKMPRHVFHELFSQQTRKLETIEDGVRVELRKLRPATSACVELSDDLDRRRSVRPVARRGALRDRPIRAATRSGTDIHVCHRSEVAH